MTDATDAREMLVEVVYDFAASDNDAYDAADAILTSPNIGAISAGALPDLVWEKLSDTCYRTNAPLFGNIRVETYDTDWYAHWSVPGVCDTLVRGRFAGPDEAKEAVEKHRRAEHAKLFEVEA